MSVKQAAVIRFDGPALRDHQMDVLELAPALLGLSELCKVANESLNGDAASVKVLVRADIEQKCFQLEFQLAQTVFETLVSIVDQEHIRNAKEILEWLGIISGATSISLLTLFGILSRRPKTVDNSITVRSGGDTVIYQVNGERTVVSKEVDAIARDPRTLPALKRLMLPLMQPGYETLEFDSGKAKSPVYIDRDTAEAIISLDEDQLDIERDGELVSTITTALRVRKPVYEGNAKWGFLYKRAIEARMADIRWLEDFQEGRVHVPVKSKLLVELQENVPIDDEGHQNGEATYTVTKVKGVILPPEQASLFP